MAVGHMQKGHVTESWRGVKATLRRGGTGLGEAREAHAGSGSCGKDLEELAPGKCHGLPAT